MNATGMTMDDFLTAWGCTPHDPVTANDQMLLEAMMGGFREGEVHGSALLEQLLAASKTATQRAQK